MGGLAVMGIVTALCLASAADADVDYWQFRGVPGFVRSLAVDPGDADVLYAGVSNAATYYGEHAPEGAGIFRSADGGRTWSESNVGLTNPMVSALVIDPSTPSVLYAATDGGGVFKSVDAAASWTPHNVGLGGLGVYALAIDPQTPTTLYAGLEGGGVWRSTDGAASWTGPALSSTTIWALVIDPATPSTLYAATDVGVVKSVNGGVGWSLTGLLGFQLPGDPTPRTAHAVRALVIDASAPSTVYAGLFDASGVFKSVDGGGTWTHSSTGLLSEYDNYRFITALAQDPLTPSTLYLSSTRTAHRSTDGGATWVALGTGLSREEGYAYATHPTGAVYFADVFGDVHRLATRASGVDHFRCFKARGRGFEKRPVTVSDVLGTTEAVVGPPRRFCTPTSWPGESITNADAPLVCYKLTRGTFSKQFFPGFLSNRVDGYRGFEARKMDSLCVPATIGGGPSGAPRDAYRCPRGPHWSVPGLDVVLSDAFGSQQVRQTKLDRWCVPTDLDGGGGANRLEPGMDLRCDRVKKPRAASAPVEVDVQDRFGTLTLQLTRPDSHCVPALEDRD
jgi:hypothetical protein